MFIKPHLRQLAAHPPMHHEAAAASYHTADRVMVDPSDSKRRVIVASSLSRNPRSAATLASRGLHSAFDISDNDHEFLREYRVFRLRSNRHQPRSLFFS